MSFSISTTLCSFVNKFNYSKIFKFTHDEMFEKLDEFDFKKEFFQSLSKEVEDFDINLTFKVAEQMTLGLFINENISYDFSSFYSNIYQYDNFKGIAILNPELVKSSRFNDDIDFYLNPKMEFKVTYCKKWNSYDYFICTKDFNYVAPYNEKMLIKKGSVISYSELTKLTHLNSDIIYPKNKDEKYFHPAASLSSYLFFKKMNFLKDNLSFFEFCLNLKPAVVTNVR